MVSLSRSILLLAVSSAAGQGILLLASILAARLYTPEQFGVFASVIAIASVSSVVATGRLDFAILLPRADSDGTRIALCALGLAAAVCCLGFALSLVLGNRLDASWLGPALGLYWAVPAASFSLGAFQVGNHLAVRGQKYNSLALRFLTYPAVTGVAQVLLGVGGASGWGLIVAVVAGQLMSFFVTAAPALRDLYRARRQNVLSRGHYKKLLSAYWRFPVFVAPSGVVNALCTQAPLLIIGTLFGVAAAGQYGLTTRLLAAPVGLISQAVGYVFVGEFTSSARRRDSQARSQFIKASRVLALASLVLFLVAAVIIQPLITLLLGSTWSQAAEFAQLLSVGVAMQLLVAPISQTAIVAGWQKRQLFLDTFRLALLVTVGISSHLVGLNSSRTVFALSIALGLGYGVMWVVNWRAAVEISRLSHR